MTIIEIPSINEERCKIVLKFENTKEIRKEDKTPLYIVELNFSHPTFTAKLNGKVEDFSLKAFIKGLKKIEKERKGECAFYDEWNFNLQIHSVDSLGHFVVRLSIWSQGNWHMGNERLEDEMNISYEIEPSLLISLADEFSALEQNTADLKN